MAKPKQSFTKSDREKKKKQKRKEKDEKRDQRKKNSNKGKGLELAIAYVDHNGQLSDTLPNPDLKFEIRAEDIQLGNQSFSKEESNYLKTGRVANYNSDKGYGFIKDSITQEKIFFHVSGTTYDVQEGDIVNYETARGPKGMNAINVTKEN
jgi:cold shock CspA family protein